MILIAVFYLIKIMNSESSLNCPLKLRHSTLTLLVLHVGVVGLSRRGTYLYVLPALFCGAVEAVPVLSEQRRRGAGRTCVLGGVLGSGRGEP